MYNEPASAHSLDLDVYGSFFVRPSPKYKNFVLFCLENNQFLAFFQKNFERKLFFVSVLYKLIKVLFSKNDTLKWTMYQSRVGLNDGTKHRYRKSHNRLLKVCCVPATSAGLPRISFFFSFFVAVAIYSTNKANKAGGTCR